MICPNCNQEVSIGDKFCEECGSPLKEVLPVEIVNNPIEVFRQGNSCPICMKDDQVQRVSALFESGVSFTRSSGPVIGVGLNTDGKLGVGIGGTSKSGISVSALSTKLAPPAQPSKSGCLGALGYFLIVCGVLLFFVEMMVSFQSSDAFASILIMISCLVGGYFIIRSVKGKNQKQMEEYAHLAALWPKLYFCSRDDVVYDPNSNFSMSSSSLQSYYKEQIEAATH